MLQAGLLIMKYRYKFLTFKYMYFKYKYKITGATSQ